MIQPQTGPLSGIRVLDFGQYIAGPMLATLLADAGAHVVRCERPDGPSFKDPGNAFLLRNRAETHVIDLKTADGVAKALTLVEAADVLVENFRPGVMERLGLGEAVCRVRNPGLVYCSLPGFGRTDDRVALAAWEGVLLAQGAAFARPTQSDGFLNARAAKDRPTLFPLPLASCFGATMGALAACAALIARARDGVGQFVEVPLSDALLEASGMGSLKIERRGPPDPLWAHVPGLYRSRDNRVLYFSTTIFRHLVALAQAAGRQDLIDSGLMDYDRLCADPEHAKRLRAEMIALFATRDAAEWEPLLGGAGVPSSMYRTTREWLRDPLAEAGGSAVQADDPVYGAVRMPGRVIDFEARTAAPAPARPEVPADAPPLAGYRVLDLSRVVAAPTAARLLADLGADVIKIDSDPEKRQTSVTEPLGHAFLNRGKQCIILDLKSPAGWDKFTDLLKDADALVTNVSLRRLEPLGLDDARLSTINPALVISYLNMHGVQGPLAGYRGYAGVADSITGLPSLTAEWESVPSGGLAPSMPPWPHTDSVGGVLGAFAAVAALYGRLGGEANWRGSTSLVRTAMLEQIPFAVDGEGIDPARGRAIASATYRLYDAADGMVFVAIAAEDVGAAVSRLGADGDGAMEARLARVISGMSAEAVAAALSFNRSSASIIGTTDYTTSAQGPWGKRGLVIEQDSPDFGKVISHPPVIAFSRNRIAAGDVPRAFGTNIDANWRD